MVESMLLGLIGQGREGTMGLCEHLYDAEEQMRSLLSMVNDHLKLHDTEEIAYGSLLAVAYHMNEALRELSFLLDQAEGAIEENSEEEIGH
jgi:hypothetical protein